MTKTIASLFAVVALFASPVAYAAVSLPAGCGPDDLKVWNTDNSAVVSCVPVAAVQKDASETSARNGQHLPIVQSGAVIYDEAGIAYQVPNVIYLPGWVDLTHTDAYRAAARLIAAQVAGNYGWGFWLSH